VITRFFTLGTRRGSKEGNQALNLKERRFLSIHWCVRVVVGVGVSEEIVGDGDHH
jgi:hypothetical protein